MHSRIAYNGNKFTNSFEQWESLLAMIYSRIDRLNNLAAQGKRIKDTVMLRAFEEAMGARVNRPSDPGVSLEAA